MRCVLLGSFMFKCLSLLQGTILPGITRASIIELARRKGYVVEEAEISVEEALDADEMFTTGTAVVLCAVGSLTYKVGHVSTIMLMSQSDSFASLLLSLLTIVWCPSLTSCCSKQYDRRKSTSSPHRKLQWPCRGFETASRDVLML